MHDEHEIRSRNSRVNVSLGMSATADARGSQFQIAIDKDGVQFGPSLDPRRHGYEHAYRDGADRGRFDREHAIRYNLNARSTTTPARIRALHGEQGAIPARVPGGLQSRVPQRLRSERRVSSSVPYGLSEGISGRLRPLTLAWNRRRMPIRRLRSRVIRPHGA
jgi:hypothetical protein